MGRRVVAVLGAALVVMVAGQTGAAVGHTERGEVVRIVGSVPPTPVRWPGAGAFSHACPVAPEQLSGRRTDGLDWR
jgi:hypothetical protein